jgi:hypothetical protein
MTRLPCSLLALRVMAIGETVEVARCFDASQFGIERLSPALGTGQPEGAAFTEVDSERP